MKPVNNVFCLAKNLPIGYYQYKFIVDGVWKYDHDQPCQCDMPGFVNNVMEVQFAITEVLPRTVYLPSTDLDEDSIGK